MYLLTVMLQLNPFDGGWGLGGPRVLGSFNQVKIFRILSLGPLHITCARGVSDIPGVGIEVSIRLHQGENNVSA